MGHLHVVVPGPEKPTIDNTWMDQPRSANSFTTWFTNWFAPPPARRTIWLSDLLPEKISGCRVMSFEYDASVFSMSTTTVRTAATSLLETLRDRREGKDDIPIVFVGHSLGGIVIKQALALARRRSSNIAERTKGIVFFGTPHRGADAAQMAVQIRNIIGSVTRYPSASLLETLQRSSDNLYKVSEDFRSMASNYAIFSFYEEYAHKVLGKVVVDKHSSIIGLPHEETMMLDGDHGSICRFAADDHRFDPVWRRIKRASSGPQ